MNVILSAFGDWMSKNWIIIVLLVVAIGLLVPTYIRQKKDVNSRKEINDSIKKGTKVITYSGVYGVVESVRETTDGKVVTIITGNSKNPTTMDIHINAIGGIDNKTNVTADANDNVVENKAEKDNTAKTEENSNTQEDESQDETTVKVTAKKSTNKSNKKTAKKSTKK